MVDALHIALHAVKQGTGGALTVWLCLDYESLLLHRPYSRTSRIKS